MRKPLRFYDIAVGKTFLSTSYRLVEVEIKYPRGVGEAQGVDGHESDEKTPCEVLCLIMVDQLTASKRLRDTLHVAMSASLKQ